MTNLAMKGSRQTREMYGQAWPNGTVGVIIRVDDSQSDEFWLEIKLSREELLELLDGEQDDGIPWALPVEEEVEC